VIKKKLPKCKECGERFMPRNNNALQRHCLNKDECVSAHVVYVKGLEEKKKAKQKTEWNKEKVKTKESLKSNADHVKELQKIVNEYVRLRDKGKECISCPTILGNVRIDDSGAYPPIFTESYESKYDAGHLFSCGGNPELRFDTDNIHGQCVYCNRHQHGNLLDYIEKLPGRIGEDNVKLLKRKKGIPRKYSIRELIEMKVKFKDLVKKEKKRLEILN